MSDPISCSEAVRRLWDFLDRSLTVEDQRVVEEHLSFCMRCCGELEFARELRRRLRSGSGSDLPADVERRLLDVIDRLDDPAGPRSTP